LARAKKQKENSHCLKSGCGALIPETKRSDAKYCSETCRAAAEKKRYCDKNPEYIKRQRRLVNEIRHNNTYGHTEFLDNPMKNQKDKYARSRDMGYRSGLEVQTARYLDSIGVKYGYENLKIEWEDLKYRTYTPDIILMNGIIIETKGIFDSADRRKHREVQRQHPELDIRFVFSNANSKLFKGAKSRYCDWCDKYGFHWAHRVIPEDWLKEKGKEIKVKKIELKTKRKD